MKTQTITLTHLPDILLVLLPERHKYYRVQNSLKTPGKSTLIHSTEGVAHFDDLPQGNWRIVSTLADVTEEAAKAIVDCFTTDEEFGSEDVFRDYSDKSFYDTALESFHSAIRASGLFLENPVKVHTWGSENADDYKKKFDDAQSRTLPIERTLILEKI